jgi:hypothetical protein
MSRKPTDLVKLNLRFSERLRAKFEKQATKNNQSLNSEIVSHLEKSLAADARMAEFREYLETEWGHDVFNLALSASKAVALSERKTTKRWVEDDETFELFTKTLVKLASNYRDVVMRNYAKERPAVFTSPNNIDEWAELFAELSGISPPHPRKYDAETAAADREASLAGWRKQIAKSRPLDNGEEQQ